MNVVAERVLWHFDEPRTDTALVRAAVWLEQLCVLCYETAAEALPGEARALARRFAAHERAHAAGMETVLQGLTVGVRNRPEPVDVVWHLPGLGHGTRATTLAQLVELEESMLSGYQEMARRIGDLELLRTVGTVTAGGAQHLVALRDALGRPLVPRAFERVG
jgi:hypothetical protein